MPRKKLSIDFGLRTFSARGGKKFLVARMPDGSVEVYAPTNPLTAARDCGARGGLIKASELWDSLWNGGDAAAEKAAPKKSAKKKKAKKKAAEKAPANGRRKAARKKKAGKRAVQESAPKQAAKKAGKRRGQMSSQVRQAFGGGRGIVRSGDMMRHLQRRGVAYRPGSVYTLMSTLRREHGIS